MEIIEKEVIKEPAKQYASRATGNAALTTGIIGTALGALNLFGTHRGLLGLGGNTVVAENCAPTAFQAWEKACEDRLEMQKGLYDWALVMANNRFNDRQTINQEMFGLYKSQIDADFGLYKSTRDGFDAIVAKHNQDAFDLYKGQRDNFDVLNAKINALETQVAVNAAVRPYQDKLIQCEIEKAYTAGINYTDRKTCKMITGQVVLPNTPTVTGFGSYCCCPSAQSSGATA